MEVIPQGILLCALDVDNLNKYQFEITDSLNQYNEMIDFYLSLELCIGFNNVKYDSTILDYMWIIRNTCKSLSNREIINLLVWFSDEVIISNDSNMFKTPMVKQADLYLIKHYNNKARATSLKWIQSEINWHNVQSSTFNEPWDLIIDYCWNDVESTFEFYKILESNIKDRIELSTLYKKDLYNANDPKIGESIMLKYIADRLKIKESDVKKLKVVDPLPVKVKDILLPYISFRNPLYQKIYSKYKSMVIYNTKSSIKQVYSLKGVEYTYGTGGLHACNKPGVYVSDDKHTIIDFDVSSFYPNIAIENHLYPRHLGSTFYQVYKYIYEERQKYPKGHVLNATYKLALNGVFGKSNSEYSFLYDPMLTMAITINGQLLLTMLIDMVEDHCKLLQANTDGITLLIPNDKIDIVHKLADDWCKITNLKLEHVIYSKFVLMNINSYIAFQGSKAKLKGLLEIDKTENGVPAYHKNSSKKIVRKAVLEYFANNASVEEYIKNHDNLYDFCISIKKKSDFIIIKRDKYGECEEDQKVIRYIITRRGMYLTKRFLKGKNAGKDVSLDKGYVCTIQNRVDISKEDINYEYYIRETYKIIRSIEGEKTITLF